MKMKTKINSWPLHVPPNKTKQNESIYIPIIIAINQSFAKQANEQNRQVQNKF